MTITSGFHAMIRLEGDVDVPLPQGGRGIMRPDEGDHLVRDAYCPETEVGLVPI